MGVRAKVTVEQQSGGKVVMTPVYEPDAAKDTENARFTKATPSGRIELGIDNPDAMKFFKPGKSYYVDFTEVTPANERPGSQSGETDTGR